MTAAALAAGEGARLRRFNALMAVLHAAQAIAVLALSNDFALPVTASFLEGPPGTAPAFDELFEVRIGPAVAAFLGISALAHLVLVTPPGYRWYVGQLAQQRNYARWVEYSFSASLMVVLIAMLTGISDIAALVALAGVNASMILFGWLQERYEQPGGGGWLPFAFGSVAGAVPWIAIVIYLISPTNDASPPGFVYGIFVSLFIFFNSFALNMWLQYRRIGPWRDYLFGERIYIWLSLTSKSALAWQVFSGTLAG